MHIRIFLLILLILVILSVGIYLYLFFKKKRERAAFIFIVAFALFIALNLLFLFPTLGKRSVLDIKESSMKIKRIDNQYFAVCKDKTKYHIYSMNTQHTTGFSACRNDKLYANEKLEVKYRYDYKVWWLIPVYRISEKTYIYFDNDAFKSMYLSDLDYNKDLKGE